MPYNHDEKSVLISIIVPVYNKERSLQNCIDSLDAQTIDKSLMEVILVNDGSTDESLSICERAAQRHSYIRVLSQKNQGVSAARNAALSQALGRYLMFLDADDFVSKATLKSVSQHFSPASKTKWTLLRTLFVTSILRREIKKLICARGGLQPKACTL